MTVLRTDGPVEHGSTRLPRPTVARRFAAFVFAAAPGVWQAWALRFTLDDAYISWRYAENLARGAGLVWNEGERVEGYTNFLWTIVFALPHALHLDVERFATWLGLALFTATLAIFYTIIATLTTSWSAAAVATLTLGMFPSFAAFATGGLETPLQVLLSAALAALVLAALRQQVPTTRMAAAIGAAAALATLTRMDAVVIAAPVLTSYAVFTLRAHGRKSLRVVAPAFTVPIVVCGAWLIWKQFYYGSPLPNTYVAKVEETGALARQGARYVVTFVQAYALYLPPAVLALGAWLARERRLDRPSFIVLAAPLVLWVLYVVLVGGDFMEYRLLMPALPLAFALTFWVLGACDPRPVRAALFAALVLAGGIWAYQSPKVPRPIGSPIPLDLLAVTPEQVWFEIGGVLREAFPGSVRPTIAVVPAGVIPYRSRLPAVDMLGLNDREVRQFTHLPDGLVGHRRLAPLDLLERRRVNFLIAFPFVRPRLAERERYTFDEFARRPYAYPDEDRLRSRLVVEVPLSADRVMLMLYLTENAGVTERIDRLGWRYYPLE